jgi:hypothetical protein
VDSAGNKDPSPATFSWTIVNPPPPPPSTTITAIDGNNVPVQNGGTTSPAASANLLPGLHQFSIQTTDHNGIQTTTPVFRWTVESTQPPPLTPIQATQQLIHPT